MGIFYGEARQLNDEGRLVSIVDYGCEIVARRVFVARFAIDTAPIIAQMIINGQEIPHWYFRSAKWIDQPYLFNIGGVLITPFRGPVYEAFPPLYGDGTFKIHEEATKSALKLVGK